MIRFLNRSTCATAVAAVVLAASAAPAAAKQLVGTWYGTVQRIDCTTGQPSLTFAGMQTFHANGTMTDTNSAPPASRGVGMGTWTGGARDYESVFRFMRFDPVGNFVGWAVVRRTIQLSEDFNTAYGSSVTELRDVNDNVIAAGCARDAARRSE